jgi:transposase
MRSKAYSATNVNDVDRLKLSVGRDGQCVTIGTDIGKYEILAVLRWGRIGDRANLPVFERPWRVSNPHGIRKFVGLLRALAADRELVVALEPSGTYGDALRQALADADLRVVRVSGKAAHDYAEVFDGVPSQHDGKDAALVAELAAIGKAAAWPYQPRSAWEQELAYWVDALEGQRRILSLWSGRIEGLLARHWPEATQVLPGSSGTLLRALLRYGSPELLAADAEAAAQLRHWGGVYLKEETVQRLLASAGSTVGVRQGEWERRQLQEYAGAALAARQQMRQCRKELRRLAQGHATLQAMGRATGVPTACVVWVYSGDPRRYASGPAYRKGMGLNLAERSSGTYQGELRISKRGSSRTRQWLYYAALRMVQKAGVRRWYEDKKARDRQGAKRALVGVMRKLALALYRVAEGKVPFEPGRLFPGQVVKRAAKQEGAGRKQGSGG